jgi:hypothetical protein
MALLLGVMRTNRITPLLHKPPALAERIEEVANDRPPRNR